MGVKKKKDKAMVGVRELAESPLRDSFRDVHFIEGCFSSLQAFDADHEQALSMGYRAAQQNWRPLYSRDGTWRSTAAADRAKELFTQLWRAEAFGKPPYAPNVSDALSVFSLGYIIHSYGLPAYFGHIDFTTLHDSLVADGVIAYGAN